MFKYVISPHNIPTIADGGGNFDLGAVAASANDQLMKSGFAGKASSLRRAHL